MRPTRLVLARLAFASLVAERAVAVDAQGAIAVGGDIAGYRARLADGGTTSVRAPVGAGFQAIDAQGALTRLSAFGSEGSHFDAIAGANDAP